MLKNYQLFIDYYCSQEQLARLSAIRETAFSTFTFRIRHLETYEPPEFKYDLIVYDLENKPLSIELLGSLASSYDVVFLINAPSDQVFYQIASDFNIRYILRAPFWVYEYESLFWRYLQTKTTELEHSLFQKLLDSAENSIVMTDIDGKILYANPYFENISGYPLSELLLQSPNIIQSNYHDLDFYDHLWSTIKNGEVWDGIFVNLSKDGQLFYEEATITPLFNSSDQVERFLKIGKNITRERLLLEQLSKEVKLARSVVNTLLPKFYSDERIDFSYHMTHYNEIGGDFIYFSNYSTTQYHFALIDVIGHGVSSALVAMTLTQMFRDYIKFLDLNQTVRSINQLITRLNEENEDTDIYVTGIFIEIDFELHNIQIINAGHPDLLILKEDDTVTRIPSSNMLLGVEEQKNYHMYTESLYDVSKLLCYTDGLYESNHMKYDHAIRILEESLIHLGNQNFFESVLHSFLNSSHINDDITLCKIDIKK